MVMARAVMAESGISGIFRFRAAMAGCKDACNTIFKVLIGTTPHAKMYGEQKNVIRSILLPWFLVVGLCIS
jgi:hypothetical protein